MGRQGSLENSFMILQASVSALVGEEPSWLALLYLFPLWFALFASQWTASIKKLEQAARTLGASQIKVFFTITLPLVIPGVISGTMLSFARSLGEFGATISFCVKYPWGNTNHSTRYVQLLRDPRCGRCSYEAMYYLDCYFSSIPLFCRRTKSLDE